MRCELKKLFCRRSVWLFLALGAVLSVASEYTVMKYALSGYIDGLKDAYARYEGQIATDAVIAWAKAD